MGKVIIGLAAVGIIAVGFIGCDFMGLIRGRRGSSGNNGSSITETDVEKVTSNTIDNTENTEESVCIIKVDEDKIYVDDVEYTSVDEISGIIKKRYSENKSTKFEYIHENAIKSTNDKVKEELHEIEKALEISVDYNED